MSFLICLRASLSFLSILAFVIASPCRQKRDSPALDLFASGETPLEDGSLTLAYATNSDADFLSSDYVDPNVSLFSSSIDGSSSAAVDGVAQKIDPDSSATTGSALEGGAPANSEPLFLGTDLEGYSEPTLTAQRLPDFGGITDFSFKGLEEEKLCPADKAPTIPSGGEKVPDTTNEIFGNDGLTPEDKRKCPGSQPIALCCISNFEENEKIQHNCYRPINIPFADCSGYGYNWERCCTQYFGNFREAYDCTHGWQEGWEHDPNEGFGSDSGSPIRPFR